MYLLIFLSILFAIFLFSLSLFLFLCLPFEGVVPGGVREKKRDRRRRDGTTKGGGCCKLRKRGEDSKGGIGKEKMGVHHEMGTIRCTRDIIIPLYHIQISSLPCLMFPPSIFSFAPERAALILQFSRPKQNIAIGGKFDLRTFANFAKALKSQGQFPKAKRALLGNVQKMCKHTVCVMYELLLRFVHFYPFPISVLPMESLTELLSRLSLASQGQERSMLLSSMIPLLSTVMSSASSSGEQREQIRKMLQEGDGTSGTDMGIIWDCFNAADQDEIEAAGELLEKMVMIMDKERVVKRSEILKRGDL